MTTTEAARGGSASLEAADYWWYRVRTDLLHTILGDFIGEPTNVLDVGSADGPSVGWLSGRGRLVSMDIDPRGLERGGVCGSAMQLPFGDDSFDVVGAFDVVEHCEPESAVLSEFARVIKPGGRLLLSVPAYQWAWSDFDEENGHYRRYTRPRLVAALEAQGFEVVRCTYAFSSMFPLFAAERVARRLKQRVARRGEKEAADVVSLPQTGPVLDRLLRRLGRVDNRILQRRDLPFGSSVVAAAVKR